MDLQALRDFVSVVQAGSFAAAARATGSPKSTLSKRVQDLEASLSLRLLERTTRKLRLTPDGTLLFERASQLVTDADDLEQLMRGREERPRGRLRVSVPVLFGQAFMGEIAAAYSQRWPETTIEVAFSDRRVDLMDEDLDCAIRVGPLEGSSMVSRTFAQSQRVLVGSPHFVGSQHAPKQPGDLARWPTVSFVSTGTPPLWILESRGEKVELRPESAISLGSVYAVRDAVRAGAGLALIPEFIIADDIKSGVLVHVLEDWRTAVADICIIYPSRRHLSARVRAFIEIVTERFPNRTLNS